MLLVPASASANAGVGINLGKVILSNTLTPGSNYVLPSMTVYNDGDQASGYEMAVTFNEKQPELKPKDSWVSFSPERFSLAPGAVQIVQMSISIPEDVKTGDYYAYLEAHTHIAAAGQPGVSAGISAAAAAKFYFSAEGAPQIASQPAGDTKQDKPPDKDTSAQSHSSGFVFPVLSNSNFSVRGVGGYAGYR